MLAAVQTKVEKLKVSGGEDLAKNLGLQEVQDKAANKGFANKAGSLFKLYL